MESIRLCDRPDSSGGLMSAFQRYIARDLHDWLGIATEDLATPAKKRIWSEIESHYAEVSAVRLAEGLSESDAQKAVAPDQKTLQIPNQPKLYRLL
jgi:hypothetical protein